MLASKHFLNVATAGRSLVTRSFATTRNRPPFVAIIGSGPAGFYTAQRLLKKLPGTRIDMYEGLPAPFGLSRYGVAPDHPEVKECEKSFEEVAEDANFSFFGNLSVGSRGVDGGFRACTVPLASLARHYDGLVFAHGSSRDKLLDVPGEDLPGVYSAREFVAWYNGHPGYCHVDFPELRHAEEATIIGQGNVALDVARMLLTPVDILRKTDMTDQALEALSRSTVKRVHIVGRRGPMQAAFTRKELRELQELQPKAYFDAHSLSPGLLPQRTNDRVKKKMLQTFHALRDMPRSSEPGAKVWSLDFLLSPASFFGKSCVEGAEYRLNTLSDPFSEGAKALPTDEVVKISSQLIFRSIGYKAIPLDGFHELGAHFDLSRGRILNDGMGRVGSTEQADGKFTALRGLYCAGWVKNGPSGKIVNTYQDANDTAENIVSDWSRGVSFLQDGEEESPQGMQGVKADIEPNSEHLVTWQDWKIIDAKERADGERQGRPRVKMATHEGLKSLKRAS